MKRFTMVVMRRFLKGKSMDEACHLRLQKLELTQTTHRKQVGVLFKKQKETDKALNDIRQIKWMVMGAVIFSIVDKLGLLNTLKLFY